MITFQNRSSIILRNNISNYHFDIQQNSLCHFRTKLYVNTSMSLDNAMVMCTAIMDNMLRSANATSYLSELSILLICIASYISIIMCTIVWKIFVWNYFMVENVRENNFCCLPTKIF